MPTSDRLPAVEIRSLDKRFGQREALSGVSLRLDAGEMVALIGASGSGKSTLLRHIPGFVTGDAGEVAVFGATMQSAGRIASTIRRDRAQVGFVFQQFNLVGRLPVITNVMVGRLHASPWWRRLMLRFSREDRQAALRALADVGIEDTAWQLDPESSRRVMELLATMNREHGCTVLVSLHQVDFAIRYCPRTIALNGGRIVYDGPSAALTPALLGELYGSAAHELFEHARPAQAQATSAPPPIAIPSPT
jgi:phosphonate transport system ATP-binding protein